MPVHRASRFYERSEVISDPRILDKFTCSVIVFAVLISFIRYDQHGVQPNGEECWQRLWQGTVSGQPEILHYNKALYPLPATAVRSRVCSGVKSRCRYLALEPEIEYHQTGLWHGSASDAGSRIFKQF